MTPKWWSVGKKWCGDERAGYMCTREKDHTGQHGATDLDYQPDLVWGEGVEFVAVRKYAQVVAPAPESEVMVSFPEEVVEPNDELAAALVQCIPNDGREHMVAVAIGTKGAPLAWEVLADGSVDYVALEPRDVYRWVVNVPRARYVGIVHNHPSGDTTPSKPDERATATVAAAGRIIGLDLAWSLVVTHENATWQEIKFKGQGGGGKGGDDAEPKRPDMSPEDEAEAEQRGDFEPEDAGAGSPGGSGDAPVSPVDEDALRAAVRRALVGAK